MAITPEPQKLQNGNSPNLPKKFKGLNTSKKPKPLGERRKAVVRQEIMVFLANLGVSGAGMSIALPSVTLNQLTNPLESFHLSVGEASWYSSINTASCPFGGLLASFIIDRVGRKRTLILSNIIGLFGCLLIALAQFQSTRDIMYIQILIGRFFSGVSVGLFFSPGGIYSAEISLPKIRGRLIMGTSIAISAGILLMYVLGYFIRNDWQLIMWICCVFQLIALFCVLPMPETPSWLMQKGRLEESRKSLRYFRGLSKRESIICPEFDQEMAQIKKTCAIQQSNSQHESLLRAIKAPEVYKPISIMIAFFCFQQFSGIAVVIVFAVQIAGRAGVASDPVLVAVMVGIARLITTFFMSNIFEWWGRKPAGMISATGMALSMYVLAATTWYPVIAETVPILSMVAIVLHIVLSTMGLLTLPFFMISEVFPQHVRGSASGFTLFIGLCTSFLVLKLYPSMEMSLSSGGVFVVYGSSSLLAVLFIYLFIPETRGRTLLEIEDYFRTGRKVSNAEVAFRRNTLQKECEIDSIAEAENEEFIKVNPQ